MHILQHDWSFLLRQFSLLLFVNIHVVFNETEFITLCQYMENNTRLLLQKQVKWRIHPYIIDCKPPYMQDMKVYNLCLFTCRTTNANKYKSLYRFYSSLQLNVSVICSLNFSSLTSTGIYSVSQERTTTACFHNTEGSGIYGGIHYGHSATSVQPRHGNLHVLGLLRLPQSTFHSSNANSQHTNEQ